MSRLQEKKAGRDRIRIYDPDPDGLNKGDVKPFGYYFIKGHGEGG